MTSNIIPPKLDEIVSVERQLLLSSILTDEGRLKFVQTKSAGICSVDVECPERDRATVRLQFFGGDARLIHYNLTPEDQGSSELMIKTLWSSEQVQQQHPYVWLLCRHKACKAMLAERDRHKGHVRKLRKAKATRDLQKADV